MRRASAAIAAALAMSQAGCSFGLGSAYVGQWRAHDEVAYRACLEDDEGGCVDRRERIKHVPERSYWGFVMPFPGALGASWVSHGGTTRPHIRYEAPAEWLRGTGRVAVGLRFGPVLDADPAIRGHWNVSLPTMVVGHYSLTERVAVHAAGGVVPSAWRNREHAFLGGRALLGMHLALTRPWREQRFVLIVEADSQWIKFDRPYLASGITMQMGFFF